jgi:hypothetical protein
MRILRQALSNSYAVLGIVALGVTLISAVVFRPRLSCSSDTTLDPSDPFATPFILHNDGYFWVSSATGICRIAQAFSNSGLVVNLAFTTPDMANMNIGPDQPAEFYCPAAIIFSPPVTDAEIEIYVKFKARLFPQSYTKACFWFTARPDKDNNLRWFPESEQEECSRPRSVVNYAARKVAPKTYPPELR